MCFLECATGSPDKTAGKRLGRNEGSRGNRTKKTTRTFVFLRYSKTHNVCRHLCFLRVRRTLGLTFQLEWPQLPSLHLFFFCVFFCFFFGRVFETLPPPPPFPRFFRHQLPKTARKKENDYADHSIYGDDRNADYDDHYRNEDDMHFFPFASSSCPFFFFFAPFLCVVFRYACACVGVCACVRRFTVDGFNCAMMAAPCFSFLVFLFKDILSCVCFEKFPTKTGRGVAEKTIKTFGQNVGGTPNRLARRRRRFMRPAFVSSFRFLVGYVRICKLYSDKQEKNHKKVYKCKM